MGLSEDCASGAGAISLIGGESERTGLREALGRYYSKFTFSLLKEAAATVAEGLRLVMMSSKLRLSCEIRSADILSGTSCREFKFKFKSL